MIEMRGHPSTGGWNTGGVRRVAEHSDDVPESSVPYRRSRDRPAARARAHGRGHGYVLPLAGERAGRGRTGRVGIHFRGGADAGQRPDKEDADLRREGTAGGY